MALGQQQNRPVTAFTYAVTGITGIISTVDNIVHGGDHTEGEYLAVALGGGSGTGAEATVTVDVNGDVTSVVITDGGIDYADTDTGLTISNVTIGGAANATVDVLAVVGEAATVTATGGTGWITGDVISAGELTSTAGVGTGLTGTVTATAGVVDGFVVVDGGTGYVASTDTGSYSGTGEVGISDSRYSNHDQYELGGAQQEYTIDDDGYPKSSYTPEGHAENLEGTLVGDPSRDPETGQRFDDNANTTKIVTKAGEPQWQVQQIDVDGNGAGATIVVFAEPGVVDRNGNLVGQDLRAEDMTDQARCEANGFVWTTATTGDADAASYGYCREVIPADVDGTATDQANCPVGYEFLVDDCNTAWDAVDVNDGSAQTAMESATPAQTFIARDVCMASGNHWESMESGGAVLNVTVDTDVATAITVVDGGVNYSVGDTVTVIGLTDVTFTVDKVTVSGAIVTLTIVTDDATGATTGEFSVLDSRCISAVVGQHDNFSLANFNYPTHSGAVDYARTTCKQYGFLWDAANYACIADSAHGALVTQATCVAAGHVWIAGSCYDGADFGDGHNRSGSFQQDPTDLPK